jgi:hypothetical protein
MAFTTAEVNTWFQTIDGLPTTAAPIPSNLSTAYVAELNATPPTASEAQIQAILENFPVNPLPPPANIATDTFYRTSVAQFVLAEFQAAWGAVPNTTQYDAWVARVIADPAAVETGGGMSQALAGTPEFLNEYGLSSATQHATTGFINQLSANLGITPGAGAYANVGLPVWEVLQNFVDSPKVIASLESPIANFQNLLLAGGTFPTGSILTLGPGGNLALTIGVDTPTTGFSGGHGGQATQAGSAFTALPGLNSIGLSNTLNSGDNLQATGAAAGDSTLNYTAVDAAGGANIPLAGGVTMNGVSTASITDNAIAAAGFSGSITGLTTVTLTSLGTPGGIVDLGTVGPGLNTALTTVNINAAQILTADMTAAALAAAPSATINVNGGLPGSNVGLNAVGSTVGYSSLTINSAGPGGATSNTLGLFTNATNTATITVTGAEALILSGTALNIDHLHTFNANSSTAPDTPDTGGVTATFTNADGLGHVAVTGGTGVNTFIFDETAAGTASFNATSPATTSTVNGGTGATNTLGIQADHGAILLPGVGANITGIATIEHTTGALGQTGALTADLNQMGSATIFDLAGAYTAFTTAVSNITSTQTVEYSGTSTPGGDLDLFAAPPVTATSVINFEMNAAAPEAALTLNQLDVLAGLKAVDIDSTGLATANIITNVANIADNINVTGATHLTLGALGFAYADPTGVIDASGTGAGGGVTAFLFSAPGSATAQTFLAGPTGTTNDAEFTNIGGGLANFTLNGADTVGFRSTQVSTFAINDAGHEYNDVLASATVNPIINIHTGGIPTFYTDVATAVAPGDATTAFNFASGSGVVATGHNNLIDITTTTNLIPAGDSVFQAFGVAVGTGAGITVANGSSNVLVSFYDATTSQAVLASVTPVANVINNALPAADVHVVGLIHETAAQYGAIASSLHFV